MDLRPWRQGHAGSRTITIKEVYNGYIDLDMLVPAYAATIHKSQGSEYSAVIIPVMTQHYAMLQRNLLYTGVTRGKRLVVLVGQKKAIDQPLETKVPRSPPAISAMKCARRTHAC